MHGAEKASKRERDRADMLEEKKLLYAILISSL